MKSEPLSPERALFSHVQSEEEITRRRAAAKGFVWVYWN